MDAIQVFSDILGAYSLVMLVTGTLLNLLAMAVCLRKKLRKTPTFVFMAFMLATDTIALFFWNIDNYLNTYLGYMMEYVSIHTCRLTTFMQMFSLQSSAYLLFALSFERYLSVQFKNWRTSYFNSAKAAIMSSCIMTVIFFMNFHVVFTIDYANLVNVTSPAICFYADGFVLWRRAHTYLYSIVPFILLSLVNSLLIYRTINSGTSLTRSDQDKAKRKNMSVSVVIMTASFILLTIPNAIAGGYYLFQLVQTRLGTLILFIADSLLFTYHSFNFIVIMVSNKKFAAEFHDIISSLKNRNRVQTNEATNSKRHTHTTGTFTRGFM